MFCPDSLRYIASLLSSPLDVYSFSLANKEIHTCLSNSYSRKLRRNLSQGVVVSRLREMEGQSRVLLGETGTGKTYLILHYILDYWRLTKNSIIVVLHGYKKNGWKERAKKMFGSEIPLFEGLKENEKGISMVSSFDPNSYELIENVIYYTSCYDSITNIPSHYKLIIVDDENIIQRKPFPIETIYVERPNLYLKKRRKEIRQLPRIYLSHPFVLSPIPQYHKEILVASRYKLEDFILELLRKHDKIVVLGSIGYNWPDFSYNKLRRENIYLREDENTFPTLEDVNKFNEESKKCVFHGCTLDFIGRSFHADCVVFYSIFREDYMTSSEAERSFFCESNTNKEITIYSVLTEDDDEILHKAMLVSRILRHHLGDVIEQRFNKIFKNWYGYKWKHRISEKMINLYDIDPILFIAYYFPSLYKYIKKYTGPIQGFHEYQMKRESLM